VAGDELAADPVRTLVDVGVESLWDSRLFHAARRRSRRKWQWEF
jgi:hypothetical protein